MTKLLAFSSLAISLLLLLFISGGEAEWCIAKPQTPLAKLQQNIDYCCGVARVDCSIIRPGGSCFNPNTLQNHASAVMNLYYQRSGKKPGSCYFDGSGLIAVNDPSFGSCHYKGGPVDDISM